VGNLSRQTDHVFEENRVMVRTLCIAVLTLTVALTNAAALAQEKSSGRVPWWRNSKIQQGLLLTDGQILQLEQIFQQQLPARIALQRDLERLDLAVHTPSTEESLMTPPRCTRSNVPSRFECNKISGERSCCWRCRKS